MIILPCDYFVFSDRDHSPRRWGVDVVVAHCCERLAGWLPALALDAQGTAASPVRRVIVYHK